MMVYVAAFAAMIWLYLLAGHGRFWQAGPMLMPAVPVATPSVAIIVPARDEADQIEAVLLSLLAQDYAGDFRVILVDDQSIDSTATIASQIADARLSIVDGAERPPGWAGKLWALSQGIAGAGDAAFLFFTDADIVHDPRHLSTLMAQAERGRCDLVSEMVALNYGSIAERLLIPAFIYFFAMLYPFAWVNDAENPAAAAAGGAVLVRKKALVRAGGLAAMRGALIDDVTLAGLIKAHGRVWLGHSTLARSIRPYDGVDEIWRMVARSAYVQLRHSPVLLAGTVMGMALVWLAAPLALVFGDGSARALGFLTWSAFTLSYVPTLQRCKLSPGWALFLPFIAIFYVLATLGSALDHYRGAGVQWKRRAYTP